MDLKSLRQSYVVIRDLARSETGQPFDLLMLESNRPAPGVPEPSVDVLDDPTKGDLRDAARAPDVTAIAPVMPTTLIRPLAPETGAETMTGDGLWGLEAIGALGSPRQGSDVTVAVLDTGIDAGHAAFAGKTLIERDFTGDGNGDLQGHGTHCAGTIFGRPVDGQRIGVAPGVSRALIGKVLGNSGGGSSAWLFNGMQWAWAQGANVLSMSLGFDYPGVVADRIAAGWPAEAATSAALEAYRSNLRAFDRLIAMMAARSGADGGMLIVAAAGNESDRGGQHGPVPYEIAASLPAAAEGVVSVGAVGRGPAGLSPANFSNTFPQISAPGVAITSAQAGGGTVAFDGTSMACPHVAGAACLWWEELAQDDFQRPSPRTVNAKLLAHSRSDVFAPGVDPTDCGVGLVSSPT